MPSHNTASYRPSSYSSSRRPPSYQGSSYVPGYSANPYPGPSSSQSQPQGNPGQLQTQQIYIPNDLVGCIIGKGGAKINEIRHMSASNIKIMEPGAVGVGVNGAPAPAGGENERLVVITGQPANIQMAVQLLYHVSVLAVVGIAESDRVFCSVWSRRSKSSCAPLLPNMLHTIMHIMNSLWCYYLLSSSFAYCVIISGLTTYVFLILPPSLYCVYHTWCMHICALLVLVPLSFPVIRQKPNHPPNGHHIVSCSSRS